MSEQTFETPCNLSCTASWFACSAAFIYTLTENGCFSSFSLSLTFSCSSCFILRSTFCYNACRFDSGWLLNKAAKITVFVSILLWKRAAPFQRHLYYLPIFQPYTEFHRKVMSVPMYSNDIRRLVLDLPLLFGAVPINPI